MNCDLVETLEADMKGLQDLENLLAHFYVRLVLISIISSAHLGEQSLSAYKVRLFFSIYNDI